MDTTVSLDYKGFVFICFRLCLFRNNSKVLLFMTGNGHVNDRQDFFSGGIDQLMRNNDLKSYYMLAPKPLSSTGVMRRTVPWKRKKLVGCLFLFFACRSSILFTVSVGSVGTCLAFPSVFVVVSTGWFHASLMPDFVEGMVRDSFFQAGMKNSISRYQPSANKSADISRISPFIPFILKPRLVWRRDSGDWPNPFLFFPKYLEMLRFHYLPLPTFEAIHALKTPDWKLNIET